MPATSGRESSPSFQPLTSRGATPADVTTRSIGDATGETEEISLIAAAAENERLAREQAAHWNARDFDAQQAAFADDVEVVLVPFDTTLRGARTARDHAVSWATAFPDAQIEVTRVVADSEGAVLEFVGRGTHTGPLVGPGGTIQPTGRFSELSLCYVYDIGGGKIRRVREYYDVASLMRNLGLAQ